MQTPSQFNVPVAVKDHSNMDLSCNVVMTHDFGVLNPIYSRFLVPGDKFKIQPEFFTYLDPLPCPTFGDVKLITRSFFVPFRILFDNWKDFISANKTVHLTGTSGSGTFKNPKMRFTDVTSLTSAIFGNSTNPNTSFVKTTAETTRNDACVCFLQKNAVNEVEVVSRNYEFTYLGRQVVSVLRGLGYNIPFIIVDSNLRSSDISSDDDDYMSLWERGTTKLSLLPLIAFYRFYIDWIVPSRFVHNHVTVLKAIQAFYDSNYENSYFFSSRFGESLGGYLYAGSAFLRDLLSLPTVYLPDDFFTSSYQNPYGLEADSSLNGLQLSNGAGGSTRAPYIDNSNSVGPVLPTQASTEEVSVINMFSLRSLGALQDMVTRGKVAGTKVQDYLKVTYGIEPGSSALDISTYLGFHSDDIKIGSVSSNADTFVETSGDGAYLGQFAGRGLGGNDNIGTFEYEAKEHGLLFVTCELVARSSYWQGLRPECMMLDRMSFFQPEFDGVGCIAIPQKLLNFSQGLNEDDNMFNPSVRNVFPDEPFGFQHTYAELKVGWDSLLGDFRVGGLNTGLDSWYLARFIQDDQPYIDETFSRMVQDNTSREYDHIFQNADNSSDHFKTRWRLHIQAVRPMKDFKESLEFEDKSGKQVSSHFNGSVNS